MTQIGGFIAPTRRPGELGVHSVDHFNFAVPDLAAAHDFYGNFGLDLRSGGNGFAIHTFGHAHRWGSVSEGSRKKLNYVSFGAFEDDFPRFRARLQELGIAQLDPPPGFESNGLWFRDPDGVLIEIRVAEKSSPNEKSRVHNPSVSAGQRGAKNRSAAAQVRPRRLSHILLFTSDVSRARSEE